MTQKEAIIEALNRLGGKANLNDIYRIAYALADFSGSKDWKATIRWYLQKETEAFRSSQRGSWELLSYQEEIAVRDKEIAELKAEMERLKRVPTEEAFIEKFVDMVEEMLDSDDAAVKEIRKVLTALGRRDVANALKTWTKAGKTPSVVDAIDKQTEALLRMVHKPTVQIDVKAGAHAQITGKGITNLYPEQPNIPTR